LLFTLAPLLGIGDSVANQGSHVLYGRRSGKRFSIYVPDELVGEVRKAIASGRRLQELMSEAGVRYTHALKARRRKGAGQ
jgi:hypothetical protein